MQIVNVLNAGLDEHFAHYCGLHDGSPRTFRNGALQRPPQRLLALNGLEQGLEVPLAEAARAVPLDDLEEQRGAVLDRLGEYLQQVTFVVAVHEDAQLAELAHVLVDLADARW